MIFLLGSKNPSKKRALEIGLQKLNIDNFKILSFAVESDTNSKPIGYEIIRGAENRNKNLKGLSIENNIYYDYLCSIEGGFSLDENGLPFVVTYCIIEDKYGKKSTGKSLGIRLTKTMFEFVKNGGSLNKVIEEILKISNNKQKSGIMGYLTSGLYDREIVDSEAVISSLIPFVYCEEREKINNHIKKYKMKWKYDIIILS